MISIFVPYVGSEVKTRLGDIKAHHFYHVNKSECTTESMLHWWMKHELLKGGDKFSVEANEVKEYICKEILIEKSYNTSFGEYVPDITIITECGNTIFFELENTNRKKVEEYLPKWIELNNIVVEIDIKDMINMTIRDKKYKALFGDGIEYKIKGKEALKNIIDDYIGGNITIVTKEDKERVSKLNWFWKDLIKYNNGELDIEYMYDLVSGYMEGEDSNAIIQVIEHKKCNNLYEELLNLKAKKVEKYIYDNLPQEYIDAYGIKLYIYNKYKNKNKARIENKILELDMCCGVFYKNIKVYDNENVGLKFLNNIIYTKLIKNTKHKDKFIKHIKESNYYKQEEINILKYKENLDKKQENKYFFDCTITDNEMESVILLCNDENLVNSFISKYLFHEIHRKQGSFIMHYIKNNLNVNVYKVITINNDKNFIYIKLNNDSKVIIDVSGEKIKIYYKNHTKTIKNIKEIDINDFINDKIQKYDIRENNSKLITFQYRSDIPNLNINFTYFKSNIHLDRFDFIKATRDLIKINDDIKSKIKKTKEEFIEGIIKLDAEYICYDNEIENRLINKILYPITSRIKEDTREITIQLNKDFTKDDYGKYRPWLINDFIEALKSVGFTNVHNIK